MKLRARVRGWLARRFRNGLLRMDPEDLKDWIRGLLAERGRGLPPREAVALLLAVESGTDTLLDEQAIRLEGGVHPKHRLTKYHDFFVGRITKADCVLDVGCGIGVLTCDIAARTGAAVVGVDMNQASIERAGREYAHPGVTYVSEDATRALPSGRFDVAVLSNVLEHIGDRVGLLRDLCRKTACARLLIRVPVFERDWRVPLRKELGLDYRLDATHQTEYTVESFADEMRDAGVSITHMEVRWGEIWAECRPVRGERSS